MKKSKSKVPFTSITLDLGFLYYLFHYSRSHESHENLLFSDDDSMPDNIYRSAYYKTLPKNHPHVKRIIVRISPLFLRREIRRIASSIIKTSVHIGVNYKLILDDLLSLQNPRAGSPYCFYKLKDLIKNSIEQQLSEAYITATTTGEMYLSENTFSS